MTDDISVLDMQIQDLNSEYLGVSRLQLMENAGMAVAQEVRRDSSFSKLESILVLCGTGGNGGDALVAARQLAHDKKVRILVLGDIEQTRSTPTSHNWETTRRLFLSFEIKIAKQSGSVPVEWFKGNIGIIDGILGTGTKGELREPIKTAVQLSNEAAENGMPVFAIDCPTGVDPQSGETKQDWIRASCTIALHRRKEGLAPELCGKIVAVDIGMPREAEFVVGPGDLLAIPPKDSEAHKGDSGKILVIGGSQEYTGAPALVALAALRGGADLAIIAAPNDVLDPIRAYSPELIVRGFEGSRLTASSISELEELISWADAVVVGPGLGSDPETEIAVHNLAAKLTALEKAAIIDADALKFVSKEHVANRIVLTPHAGEFLNLTGKKLPSGSKNLSERWKLVKEIAKEWNCTFLVKGKWDIIADPNRSKINLTGCSEMTVGGTGDVLAGLTAAFYGMGCNPFYSANIGAFLNGLGGERALASQHGVTPLGIIQNIPRAIQELRARI